MERLRGKLRISVRKTGDGLGIHIPPSRQVFPVGFLSLWLCGWAAGEYFALHELVSGGITIPDLFLLIWIVPWTIAGLAVMAVIAWQVFGVEQLFFTAGALVREWAVLGVRRRLVIPGSDILSVKVDTSTTADLAGFGTIKVTTTKTTIRIGSGLSFHEAELVATLIRDAGAENQGVDAMQRESSP